MQEVWRRHGGNEYKLPHVEKESIRHRGVPLVSLRKSALDPNLKVERSDNISFRNQIIAVSGAI